ncbi:MAG: hypothetical protein ACI9OJ_004139, partial [Myxococcota bacterium]
RLPMAAHVTCMTHMSRLATPPIGLLQLVVAPLTHMILVI